MPRVITDIQERYDAFKAKGLALDLTRGKPSAAQLDLSNELLSLPGADYLSEGATDCRNYGGLQGLVEARRLFSGVMGAPPEQVVVSTNSSLALMHDTIVYSLLKGTCDSEKPWSAQGEIAFVCPVPGYDRHFRICEDYGIRMIPVPLLDDGPDMDQVERLVAQDPSIKGIWCVPKYSNPTGSVYSDSKVGRLAAMKAAAPDFRLYWDNAYAVHHLTDERIAIANILDLCAAPRPSESSARVRVHLQDHARRIGAGALRRLEGQRRVAAGTVDAADDRSGQDQPVASRPVSSGRRRDPAPHGSASSAHRAEVPESAAGVRREPGGSAECELDEAQGRLFHQPDRAHRLRQASGCAGERSRHRSHAGGRTVSARQGS